VPEERILTIDSIPQHRPFGFFCDIDGTIAPIVATPGAAMVSPRARERLRELARVADFVAVVTGRDLSDARRMVGLDDIAYVGNHGLEWWLEGRQVDAPYVDRFRYLIAKLADDLGPRLDIRGVLLERKGPVLAIHYRLASDPEAARDRILRALSNVGLPDGLGIKEAIKVVEVFPAVDVNKGIAVRTLVERIGLASAMFAGDDWTDLDAFRALKDLRGQGKIAARVVAVRHAETPEPVVEAADEVVAGVPGTEALLERVRMALATPGPSGP
jgi:trehalose 6-phosphate phosphatase